MRRIRFLALLAALGLAAACGEDPTAPPEGLVGLWNLPYQEAPAFWGFQSAQMVFREDGTFEFVGTSMLSSMSNGSWRLEGTWTLEASVLTLAAAQTTTVFDVRIEGGNAYLTDRGSRREHHIFRPLPD